MARLLEASEDGGQGKVQGYRQKGLEERNDTLTLILKSQVTKEET